MASVDLARLGVDHNLGHHTGLLQLVMALQVLHTLLADWAVRTGQRQALAAGRQADLQGQGHMPQAVPVGMQAEDVPVLVQLNAEGQPGLESYLIVPGEGLAVRDGELPEMERHLAALGMDLPGLEMWHLAHEANPVADVCLLQSQGPFVQVVVQRLLKGHMMRGPLMKALMGGKRTCWSQQLLTDTGKLHGSEVRAEPPLPGCGVEAYTAGHVVAG